MKPEFRPRRTENSLLKCRKRLDKITIKLIELVRERNDVVSEVGKIKKKMGIPIVNLKREKEVINNARILAKKMKVDEDLAEELMRILITYAKKIEVSK